MTAVVALDADASPDERFAEFYDLDDDPAKPILALAREARLSKCKDVWEGYNLAHPLVHGEVRVAAVPRRRVHGARPRP